MDNNVTSFYNTAIEAAFKCGCFLLKEKKKHVEVIFENGRDIKLKLDQISEERIVNLLKKKSSLPVLGEELNFLKNPFSIQEYYWIVDPLDGSLNYSRKIPLSCISIGLWKAKDPILGVIYDFNSDEMYSGIVGKGAWLNDQEIKVSKTDKKKNAIITTGFPISTDFSDIGIKHLISFVKDFKKIRLLGSAALSLAYVAAGRVDAYYERDIRIWDVAAGIAIVKAAGGQSIYTLSKKSNCLTVYSLNRKLSIKKQEN